jgi:hypothetical protein
MVAFATNRIRWRMKMSNTHTVISTLIGAVLSIGASAVDSSAVYAKGHRLDSLRPQGSYAQVTVQEAERAAVRNDVTFGYPRTADGQVVNYADYQRGGSN